MKPSDNNSNNTLRLYHQTFAHLQKSAQGSCYICHNTWINASSSGSYDDVKGSASLSNPFVYRLGLDKAGRQLYHLDIHHKSIGGSNPSVRVANFRIVPSNALYPVRRSTSQIETLERSLCDAVTWLNDCRINHPVCARGLNRGKGWAPTRLINIGPPESTFWKLEHTNISCKHQEWDRYISLSYRWGREPRLTLRSDTIDKFQTENPIAVLPKTFRDFVQIASRLGARYVWIDALCIIQDSLEDWNQEALKMKQVYANSLCTIAATASADEDDGIFRHLSLESTKPGLGVMPSLFDSKHIIVYKREYWDEQLSKGPLHGRGWVFQERHLSPRILHFGRQLLWECMQVARCEAFPNGMPYHVPSKTLGQLEERTSLGSHTAKQCFRNDRLVQYLWRNLVRDYVLCSFTKAEDKLIAFAGIAQAFQEATGDEYLAGIWRSHLSEGLDWRVYAPITAASSYRAPSWSWASIDGPLRPELATGSSKYPFEVLDAQVTLAGDNPMSEVIDGHLTLNAFLVNGSCYTAPDRDKRTLCVGFSCTQVLLCADTTDVVGTSSQVVDFMPLHCFQERPFPQLDDRVTHVVCLWLKPTTSENMKDAPTYRRFGYFVIEDQTFLAKIGFLPDESGVLLPPKEGGNILRII